MHQDRHGTLNGHETLYLIETVTRHEGQIGEARGELKHLRQRVTRIEDRDVQPLPTNSDLRELMRELAPWVSGVVVLVLALMQRWDLVQKFLDSN